MSVPGLVAVAVVVVVVAVAGALLRRRSGRVRTPSARPSGVDGWELAGVRRGDADRVLLLQLSSPVCAPCRTTAGVLDAFVTDEPGLRHVEVDVADRVEIARALGVLSTPTTVAFGPDGAEMLRVSGVPRVDELRAALAG